MPSLIERLRARHENAGNPWAYSEAIECYERERAEAADEIEALLREIRDMKEEARELSQSGGNYWGDMAAQVD